MQTKKTDRPIDHAVAAIQALDLHPIRLRLMDRESGEGWTQAHAENIELAYRSYLTTLVKHPECAEDVVVSREVDEFWHMHILHTMKYMEDCERVFGKYLHHSPRVGNAAFCGANLESKSAAFCGANLESGSGAFCGASLEHRPTAFCGASLEHRPTAFCGASLEHRPAAFCGASLESKSAAFCGANLESGSGAFCGASVRTSDGAVRR